MTSSDVLKVYKFISIRALLKLSEGHLQSTMKEERLDILDYYFSETEEDIMLYAFKLFHFSDTTFHRS